MVDERYEWLYQDYLREQPAIRVEDVTLRPARIFGYDVYYGAVCLGGVAKSMPSRWGSYPQGGGPIFKPVRTRRAAVQNLVWAYNQKVGK